MENIENNENQIKKKKKKILLIIVIAVIILGACSVGAYFILNKSVENTVNNTTTKDKEEKKEEKEEVGKTFIKKVDNYSIYAIEGSGTQTIPYFIDIEDENGNSVRDKLINHEYVENTYFFDKIDGEYYAFIFVPGKGFGTTDIYSLKENRVLRGIYCFYNENGSIDYEFDCGAMTIDMYKFIWNPALENVDYYKYQIGSRVNNGNIGIVTQDNEFVMIDLNGNVILEPKKYDKVLQLSNNYLLVRMGNSVELYNTQNKFVTKVKTGVSENADGHIIDDGNALTIHIEDKETNTISEFTYNVETNTISE